MRISATTGIMILTIICSSFVLSAQKQQPDLGLTFGETSEKEYLLRINKRVDAETGTTLVAYSGWDWVQRAEPEVMAKNYLSRKLTEFGLTEGDLENLNLHFVRESVAGTTVRLRQFWKGVPVHGAEVTVTVSARQRVIMANNFFAKGIDLENVTPSISTDQARTLAINHLNANDRLTDETQGLFILPREEGARLAHRIQFLSFSPVGNWEVFVDARSGEILQVKNVDLYHKHEPESSEPKSNVPFPMMVDGLGNVFVPDPLSSAGVDYGDPGFSDSNDNTTPQLIAEQVQVTMRDVTFENGEYFLKGPWAEINDAESPFRGVFSQATSDWSVDRDGDEFEATNCYFHIDESMRYLNETLGLDIRPSLYPGGVLVDPSGFNDADNSHYVGQAQRLAFGDGGVDDAEDSDVIHHELGHGLHDWVTGGSLSQVQGLSEGCGDYWAASYNRSLGDWAPGDPQYGWVFNWDGHNPFWNGRNCDVSTTWSQNIPLGGIHAQGQVWSTSMMQVYDAIGKMKTDIIFWEGLGMTSGSSNQNDAANAVYQASLARPECTRAEREAVHTILSDRGYILPEFAVPVSWLSIAATPRGKAVAVTWATGTESGSDHFEIERSLDNGQTFTSLGRVAAVGETTERTDYSFTDESPVNGQNIYRIRQVDFDGTLDYSDVVTLTFGESNIGSLSPNPTDGMLRLQTLRTAPEEVSVLDLQGRVMAKRTLTNGSSFSVAELPAGVYLLRYLVDREVVTRRFVKR